MKEKDVNIDSQTEEFFLDNIKKNEILSKIQQIINSEDVNKISVLNKLVEKFEEKNKDFISFFNKSYFCMISFFSKLFFF